jgi:hypothetical protein
MKKIEPKIIKFINLFLERFNRRIVINRGNYLIQNGVVKYECGSCQKNLTALPDFRFQQYSYELQNLPSIQSQDNFVPNEESYEVYGWVIERKSTIIKESKWKNSKPHKIYTSREVALDSIIQLKNTEDDWIKRSKYEYRVKPIYHIESSIGIRNVLINKILKK